MQQLVCLALASAVLLAAAPAEELVLHNGFRIATSRVEVRGDTVIAYTDSGTLEFPRTAVAAVEKLEQPPSPAEEPAQSAAHAQAPASAPLSPQDRLRLAAADHGLPAEFVLSVAKVESAFRPAAISPKGAIGVMQLMPATARALNVDPHDPAQNIEGGARLLRDLLLKYQNYPDQVYRALSAYNAGEGAVSRYNGIPPYAETRHYVEKVLNEFERLKKQPRTGR
jgi:soluble lytic murein transglycosylase-like protein